MQLQLFEQFLDTHFWWLFSIQISDFLLTCMFGKLLKEFISVPIFWDVTHKQSVVVKWNCHTQFFSFPHFEIIKLKIMINGTESDKSRYILREDLVNDCEKNT